MAIPLYSSPSPNTPPPSGKIPEKSVLPSGTSPLPENLPVGESVTTPKVPLTGQTPQERIAQMKAAMAAARNEMGSQAKSLPANSDVKQEPNALADKKSVIGGIQSMVSKIVDKKFKASDIAILLKNSTIAFSLLKLSKLNGIDFYAAVKEIRPGWVGDVIYFNSSRMCPVTMQKDPHQIELPAGKSLRVEYSADTKLQAIQKYIQEETKAQKVVFLRNDIIDDVWIVIDASPTDDDPPKVGESHHLAIGVVDAEGKGAIYELPADPKVTEASTPTPGQISIYDEPN